MPHVIIKLAAGRGEQQKRTIAEAVAQAVVASAGCRPEAVSVSIEDVAPADWIKAVYTPAIIGKPDTLYKKPGYVPPA